MLIDTFDTVSRRDFSKIPDQLRLKFVEIPWNLQGLGYTFGGWPNGGFLSRINYVGI